MQYPTGLISPKTPGHIFFNIFGFPTYITPWSPVIFEVSFLRLLNQVGLGLK